MRLAVTVMVSTLVACGDNQRVELDAAPTSVDGSTITFPQTCWPTKNRRPAGWAELGTGRDSFEAMPEVLPLEYGTQDGYMLIAHVRMGGMTPGNEADLLDPENPRTRIRAYFADTGEPLNYYAHCPFRYPYVKAADGSYQLPSGVPVIFETCWRSDHLFGRLIRIELELLDHTGAYTTDTKIVQAAPSAYYPPDQGTPGCQHRPIVGPDLREQ